MTPGPVATAAAASCPRWLAALSSARSILARGGATRVRLFLGTVRAGLPPRTESRRSLARVRFVTRWLPSLAPGRHQHDTEPVVVVPIVGCVAIAVGREQIATLVVVPGPATQDTVPSYRTASFAGVCRMIPHALNLPAKSCTSVFTKIFRCFAAKGKRGKGKEPSPGTTPARHGTRSRCPDRRACCECGGTRAESHARC